MQGSSSSATYPCREVFLEGKGRERPLPFLHGQSLHTHTHTPTQGKVYTRLEVPGGHAYLQAGYTPSLQEGETRVQGPWWWTTEKRSGGEGDRDPGERIQSQNKKKRWRMESKNKTKYCQLNRGEKVGGSHQHTHAAHTGDSQHSRPLQGVPLGGNGVVGTTVGTPTSVDVTEAAQVWKGARVVAGARGSSPPAAVCRPC